MFPESQSKNNEINWHFKYAYIGRSSIINIANWFSQRSTISAYHVSGRDKSSPHLSITSLRWRTLPQRTEGPFGHNKGTARSVLHTTYKCIRLHIDVKYERKKNKKKVHMPGFIYDKRQWYDVSRLWRETQQNRPRSRNFRSKSKGPIPETIH